MESNSKLIQSLKAIENVANNESWFRDTPHRWATASLPLAYAVACVEVVSKSSEKAGAIYQQIIEAWIDPDIKHVFDEINSLIPESEREKIQQAFIHPESEFLPDPNKPFKQLEEMFTGLEINEDFFKNDDTEQLSPEDEKEAEKFAELICLIMEFIIVGFNRESDRKKGRYRVILSEKAPWLIWAVMIRTLLESYNITLERLRNYYKVRKYKGKVIDFHKVLAEQPMSRWHRRMIASGKVHKLILKNDRIFVNAAHAWYKCRVYYSSVKQYCDALAKDGIILEMQNVYKQIRPCDDALGYIRRLPRKLNK